MIDPVVIYYRQRAVLANLADDRRGERYPRLRQRTLHRDFVALTEQADRFAGEAETEMSLSLNTRGAGSWVRISAEARDGVSARDEASRSDP